MSGLERYLWFAGALVLVTLLSYGIAAIFDLDGGGRVLVVVAVAVPVALVAAPIFRRRGGYRR